MCDFEVDASLEKAIEEMKRELEIESRKFSNYKELNDYVILDTEYQSNTSTQKLVEISALKIRDGKINDKFSTYVNPKEPLCQWILNNTNMTDELMENSPELEDVLPLLIEFISDDVIVGHNVRTADIDKINEGCHEIGLSPLTNKFLDTYELVQKTNLPCPTYNLHDLCNYLGIINNEEHNSLFDCEATYHFFEILKHIPLKQTDVKEQEKTAKKKVNKFKNPYSGEIDHEAYSKIEVDHVVETFLSNECICFSNVRPSYDFCFKLKCLGLKDECFKDNYVKSITSVVWGGGSETGKVKKAKEHNKKIISYDDFVNEVEIEFNKYFEA